MDAARLAEAVSNGNDRAIMMALLKIGDRGTKSSALKGDIAKLLSHSNIEVRCVAAGTFVAIGGKPGIPDAMHLLDDKEPRVRGSTASAMSRVGGKHIAYPVIRRMLASEVQSERKAAELVLDFLDADFSIDKPCREELAQAGGAIVGTEFEEVKLTSFAIKAGHVIDVRMYKASDPDVEATHQAALSLIAAVDKRLLARIGRDLASLHEVDEKDSSEDACTLRQAIIPPHGSGKEIYYFLLGDSDIDIEHGFVCLFRNKKDFCIVDFDAANNVNAQTKIEAIGTLFDDCSRG